MEATDPDVDDARLEPRTVVPRHRNPLARDLREVGLIEPDRAHRGSQYKHRDSQ
jgi:hypothetical protein